MLAGAAVLSAVLSLICRDLDVDQLAKGSCRQA